VARRRKRSRVHASQCAGRFRPRASRARAIPARCCERRNSCNCCARCWLAGLGPAGPEAAHQSHRGGQIVSGGGRFTAGRPGPHRSSAVDEQGHPQEGDRTAGAGSVHDRARGRLPGASCADDRSAAVGARGRARMGCPAAERQRPALRHTVAAGVRAAQAAGQRAGLHRHRMASGPAAAQPVHRRVCASEPGCALPAPADRRVSGHQHAAMAGVAVLARGLRRRYGPAHGIRGG